MVIKWGRNGHFLACSGYPECRNTKEFIAQRRRQPDDGAGDATIDEICETCGAPMLIKRGRFGEFLACSRYPECKTTSPISLGVNCPKPGCGGYLTEKRSRRGKVFFGCSNYSQDQVRLRVVGSPAAAAVPEVRRQVRRPEGRARPARASAASTKGCDYTADPEAHEPAPAAPPAPAAEARRRPAPSRAARRARRRRCRPRARSGRGRAHQRRDRLDVARLREHVERLHAQRRCSRRRPASRCRAPASPGCTTRRRSCAARTRRAARGSRRRSPCAADRR